MNSHENTDDLIACPSCDQLYDLQHLEPGDKAKCASCGHLLSTCYKEPFTQVMAYSVAGLILFVMSCAYPFMSFKTSGLESVMTLPQAISQIEGEGMWGMAYLVACFILILPTIVLVLSGFLALSLSAGWRNHWAKDIAKIIFHLKTWCMVEVFFFGVLVSLVKIAHMATVVIGVAFWAYAAFSILFTLVLLRLDTYHTWKRLEELEP